jgi:hypothetical protein
LTKRCEEADTANANNSTEILRLMAQLTRKDAALREWVRWMDLIEHQNPMASKALTWGQFREIAEEQVRAALSTEEKP